MKTKRGQCAGVIAMHIGYVCMPLNDKCVSFLVKTEILDYYLNIACDTINSKCEYLV